MSSWILDMVHAALGGNKSDSANHAYQGTPPPEYTSHPHPQMSFSAAPQGFGQTPPAPRTITSGGGGHAEGPSTLGGHGGNVFVTRETPRNLVTPPPTDNLKEMTVGGNAGNIVVPPEETANIQSGPGGNAKATRK